MKLRDAVRTLLVAGATVESSLRNEQEIEAGFVYIISHPSWPGCYKVGTALNPESRLQAFQTGCPKRAYKLEHYVLCAQRLRAEAYVHENLAPWRLEGEWFEVPMRRIRTQLSIIEDTP